MPSLDTIPVRICESNDGWSIEIKSSDGKKSYIVTRDKYGHKFEMGDYDWSCTCPAYKFKKGYCKHIEEAKEQFCGWGEPWDEGGYEPVTDEEDLCPKCGGPVIHTGWAV